MSRRIWSVLVLAVSLVATAHAGPLHDDARAGDVAQIRCLLAADADVNEFDNSGKTPLHIASAYGQVGAINVLIRAGANVNTAETESGFTPLHVAVAYGQLGAVIALVAAGADVNDQENRSFSFAPLHVAVGANASSDLYIDASDLESGGPANVAIIRVLLAAGADPNAYEFLDGYTPLQHAAAGWGGHLIDGEIIRALLSAGADPNERRLFPGDPGPDDFSLSALHYAARDGNVGVIRELLAFGADVNIMTTMGPNGEYRSEGVTPLDYAVAADHPEAAALLRAEGGRNRPC